MNVFIQEDHDGNFSFHDTVPQRDNGAIFEVPLGEYIFGTHNAVPVSRHSPHFSETPIGTPEDTSFLSADTAMRTQRIMDGLSRRLSASGPTS